MKILILIIIVLSSFIPFTNNAQNYWQGMGVSFNYEMRNMYYDSVSEKSYIFGAFKTFNGDSANVVVYDSSGFDVLPLSPNWSIHAMVRYKDKLYAAGIAAGLSVWDGQSWSVIEQNYLFNNLRVYDDKLYVTGNFRSIGNVTCTGVAVYNDTVWSSFLGIDTNLLPVGNSSSDITFYKGKTYVCGNFYNPNYPNIEDIMMHDGNSWQPVGNFQTDGLGDLRIMLVWRDTLYVAGMISEEGNAPGNSVAAWDGQNWHRLQDGLKHVSQGAATDITIYNDELWACGYFAYINGNYVGEYQTGVAKWDGTQWCTTGLKKTGSPHHFGRWKDELFMVGEFGLYDSPSQSRVLKWTGGNYTDTCIQNYTTNIKKVRDKESVFHVYPNPAKNTINIQLPDNKGFKKIIISDLIGRVFFSKTLSSSQSKEKIDVSSLPNGLFLITVEDKNGKCSIVKFLKD